MVPRGLGDGSIIGTTVIQQPANQPHQQPHPQASTATRKGILKRTPANPNQDSAAPSAGNAATAASAATSMSQNKWDYEISPSSTDTNKTAEHHHHVHAGHAGGQPGLNKEREPDILQLPMGLPPPPGTTISGRVFPQLTYDSVQFRFE